MGHLDLFFIHKQLAFQTPGGVIHIVLCQWSTLDPPCSCAVEVLKIAALRNNKCIPISLSTSPHKIFAHSDETFSSAIAGAHM